MLGNGKLPYQEGLPAAKVKGKNLRILVPHNWELSGAEPLVSRLRQEFNVWAVETLDTRKQILAASRKLSGAKIGGEYDQIRAALFKLQDIWTRLRKLNAMLWEERDGAVLELHCMPRDNHRWDGFVWEDYYFRIKGTWLIMPSEMARGAYVVPLNDTIDFLWYSGAKAGDIAPFFEGLDLATIRAGKDAELEKLHKASARAALLEVPVKKRDARLEWGLKLRTDFEERHLGWQSLPANLSEEEMRAVFGLFECYGKPRW